MIEGVVARRDDPARRDFPFTDRPGALSPAAWVLVMVFTAAGFAALLLLPTVWRGPAGRWVSVILYVLIPLLGLRLVARDVWRGLFHWPTRRDVLIGLAAAPATLLASGAVAVVLWQANLTVANPAMGILAHLEGVEFASFFASTAPQLLGEELSTILPFLAVLSVLHAAFNVPRRTAIALAWIGSALLFGALHLPTYQWHVSQALLVIGAARLVLTVPYLLTKNLWSSFIAHLTHDWMLFALVLWGASLAKAA